MWNPRTNCSYLISAGMIFDGYRWYAGDYYDGCYCYSTEQICEKFNYDLNGFKRFIKKYYGHNDLVGPLCILSKITGIFCYVHGIGKAVEIFDEDI